MTIFINPGSGPVADSTEADARCNMAVLINDVTEAHGLEVISDLNCMGEDDGRFTYDMTVDGRRVEIDMPGLPIEAVRWVDGPDQNIWDFPRLYVDGSSWVWKYAINACGPDDES